MTGKLLGTLTTGKTKSDAEGAAFKALVATSDARTT
jgi:hypothetical protein